MYLDFQSMLIFHASSRSPCFYLFSKVQRELIKVRVEFEGKKDPEILNTISLKLETEDFDRNDQEWRLFDSFFPDQLCTCPGSVNDLPCPGSETSDPSKVVESGWKINHK